MAKASIKKQEQKKDVVETTTKATKIEKMKKLKIMKLI